MPKPFDPNPQFTISNYETDTISELTSAAGVTVDGVLLKDSQVNTDQINEKTGATGVTIDGVLLKDSVVKTDTIVEKTSATGVTADGVLLKDGGIVCADAATLEVDTVNEATAAAGVTVDGVLLKDGNSNAGRQIQILTASGAITIKSGLVILNHATVVIAATLAAPVAGADLVIVDGSASGTAAHTVTLTAATYNVTGNTIATLNAPDEAIHIVAQSTSQWRVVSNVGSVALSGP